ncbi:MAG TPA: hypothetical protein VNO30_06110 [Kofleriaceae bacterium]|nr:hypothetical protein [Kofleriaceae bacterium]
MSASVDGVRWLRETAPHRVASAPACSPKFMAMEGVLKMMRKLTTHNTLFVTPE